MPRVLVKNLLILGLKKYTYGCLFAHKRFP